MAKGRKTGGRKKGTPNKRQDLQEFLDDIFEQVDPAQLAVKRLKANDPNGRFLIRLLEYRYGRPPLSPEGELTMPRVIDVSIMRSRPSTPRPPSEPYPPTPTNLSPSVNETIPITPEPSPVVQNSPTSRPDIPLVRKRVYEAPT
jgi:hypothetical protein